MVIDVGPLLRGEVHKINIDYMLTPETLYGIVFESDENIPWTVDGEHGGDMNIAEITNLPRAFSVII